MRKNSAAEQLWLKYKLTISWRDEHDFYIVYIVLKYLVLVVSKKNISISY